MIRTAAKSSACQPMQAVGLNVQCVWQLLCAVAPGSAIGVELAPSANGHFAGGRWRRRLFTHPWSATERFQSNFSGWKKTAGFGKLTPVRRLYTVPLCLGVRDPGIAELRRIRVV